MKDHSLGQKGVYTMVAIGLLAAAFFDLLDLSTIGLVLVTLASIPVIMICNKFFEKE